MNLGTLLPTVAHCGNGARSYMGRAGVDPHQWYTHGALTELRANTNSRGVAAFTVVPLLALVGRFRWQRKTNKRFGFAGGKTLRRNTPSGRSEDKFCSSRGFDPLQWRLHSEPTRYVTEIGGLITGRTTRRVFPAVLAVTIFSSLVERYHYLQQQDKSLPHFELPVLPFELTAPLLGLLLVFRTDKSYDRYLDVSEAMWTVSGKLRDLFRGLLTNTADESPRATKDVSRACDLIVSFHSWLFKWYFNYNEEEDRSRHETATQKMNILLGRQEQSYLAPTHFQLAISQEINKVPNLNEQQRQGLDFLLVDVTAALTTCDRIIRMPIPLGYTRSTVRFLWVWLSLLPFALVGTVEELTSAKVLLPEDQFEIPIMTFLVALTFLSLEDVAVQIEQPFDVQRFQFRKLADFFEEEASELRQMAKCPRSSTSSTNREPGLERRRFW
eukprot:CAMPEP_0172680292 /NCGR_PEP_ID=MMETSP1074-20121228/16665_1 /TAXON_ID=2916 /ORGANISM="Ceratium fusus, Strain PA161109" /LENGTH=440 /DNA_ID=CAMNT_0013498601 /DNA_START=1 /DNA_END=1320 /DNA_ORIENTATION=-